MVIGLSIAEEPREGKWILRVEGRLDANASPLMEKKVNELIEASYHRILIDFSKLEYLSSAGLRQLLSATKRLKALGGQLVLCRITDEVMGIIKMAGFDRVLNIFSNEEDALAALG